MKITESGTIRLIFKLLDRGISDSQIDRAMRKMVGSDWREVEAAAWLERFKESGYLSPDTAELSADDLEALIKASLELERY